MIAKWYGKSYTLFFRVFVPQVYQSKPNFRLVDNFVDNFFSFSFASRKNQLPLRQI
jgi:hypothetical protein